MIPQHPAKIFPARQRGLTQIKDDFRAYHTFNFPPYFDENKEAPGNLLFLNDETLNIGVESKTEISESDALLLLPLVGGVSYQGAYQGLVEAGEACLLSAGQKSQLTLSNPYSSELINFLQIGIRTAASQELHALCAFDLANEVNTLLPLRFSGEASRLIHIGSIGQFVGRNSAKYQPVNPRGGVFAFVIDGVFEVQDRLLQARDGLALWEVEEVEFEALSDQAILLFLEMEAHL